MEEHTVMGMCSPMSEAGEQQWLGTEDPGEPRGTHCSIPTIPMSCCVSSQPRAPDGASLGNKPSRMRIGQPISLPLIVQNQHFPDNFSLFYQLITRAGGNSVFSLNTVIQHCVELHT